MEIIVAIAFFLGGYEWGQASVEAPVCASKPLVTTECPAIQPPADDTFGATTRSYSSLVTQYKKCKVACEGK
jgi:hypothetical protein